MAVDRFDVVIVGGGFAGAATAYHLSRSSGGSILLVEKEATPGAHASGRNASLLRQSIADPEIRRALVASREAYLRHRQEIGFREVGSVLLGGRDELARVRNPEVESRLLDSRQVVARLPILSGHRFAAALLSPGDGVVDTWALLNFYLDGARARGVRVRTGCEVTRIDPGPPYRVTTSRGDLEASFLVNAAGAWAPRVAAVAGIEGPRLTALKRHLFLLDGIDAVADDQPFVWSLAQSFYLRPESGGLLFSLCDEEPTDLLEETVSAGISEALAELISGHLPRLQEARVRNVWSCFRTRTDDHRFVIGWDPVAKNFLWVAGLGGNGMGASWEVGRLAADVFLGRDTEAMAFAPDRPVAAS